MTRFQRLFISTSAFTLIAPPLFQVYCQTELPDVRDGIEYAVRRFLNVQEEAFVFQLCASLAHVVLDTSIVDPAQRRWIAQSLFALLASLSTPLAPEAGVGLGLRGEAGPALIRSRGRPRSLSPRASTQDATNRTKPSSWCVAVPDVP